MSFKIQFLGTGTSVGVPMIGCSCPVCSSSDPRDNRMRSSVYLTLGERVLLIDTPPEFRLQAIRFKVPRVDGVAITHIHVDHLFGFDDIRRFNTIQDNAVIPAYADPETMQGIKRIFNYISEKPLHGLFRPLIRFTEVVKPFAFYNAVVTPLPVIHGSNAMTGFRVDYENHSFAYVPDCHELPDSTLKLLENLDVMVLDGLRYRQHGTHLTIEQSCGYLQKIRAKKSYLTHLSHDCLHADLLKTLPPDIEPAYDGLTLVLE